MADILLNVGLRTDPSAFSALERDIAARARNIAPIKIRVDKDQVLGRISRDAQEFQKSISAANARVLAFAASAGSLFTIQRGFNAILEATTKVEKSLADINVVFGLSSKQLKDFSNSIFDVANKTGQSFDTAAKAALEFSRQGLSVTETLKRTNDALILTRRSGLEVSKSVDTITAALNGFNDAALDSTKLVNKLINVDTQFAVSAADLAEGFQRVGSTASDVGVQIDSLVGLITSAQQATARGGSVIGNALKTIFQRIQRPEVLDTLRELNIQIEDQSGNLLSADKVLVQLARTYDTATAQQKNFITQLAAGVFQANQFKAILGDLSRENSVFTRATNASKNSIDAITSQQEELNKTLAASLNTLVNNLTQASAKIGDKTLKPLFDNIGKLVVGPVKKFADSTGAEDGGAFIGKGILKGIGDFLSGPGLALASLLAAKFFGQFAKFSAQSLSTILESQRSELQTREQITALLARQPELTQQIIRGDLTREQVQQRILGLLKQELVVQSELAQVAIAVRGLTANNYIRSTDTGFRLTPAGAAARTRASGHIPERDRMAEIMGAYSAGYTPGEVKRMYVPNMANVVYNTAEKVITPSTLQANGIPATQPAIVPPESSRVADQYARQFQSRWGKNPYTLSNGLVPNFNELDQSAFKRLLQGKRLSFDPTRLAKMSHAGESGLARMADEDKNELLSFFRNPTLDSSRISHIVPSRNGGGELEVHYILPSNRSIGSNGISGQYAVLAVHPDKNEARFVTLHGRRGIAAKGLIPNFARRMDSSMGIPEGANPFMGLDENPNAIALRMYMSRKHPDMEDVIFGKPIRRWPNDLIQEAYNSRILKVKSQGHIPNFANIPIISPLIGRLATNITHSGSGFGMEAFSAAIRQVKSNGLSNALKLIIKDKPLYGESDFFGARKAEEYSSTLGFSDYAFRKMFGLKPRIKPTYDFTEIAKNKVKLGEESMNVLENSMFPRGNIQKTKTGYSWIANNTDFGNFEVYYDAESRTLKMRDVWDFEPHSKYNPSFRKGVKNIADKIGVTSLFKDVKSIISQKGGIPILGTEISEYDDYDNGMGAPPKILPTDTLGKKISALKFIFKEDNLKKRFLESFSKETNADRSIVSNVENHKTSYDSNEFTYFLRKLVGKVSSPIEFTGEKKIDDAGHDYLLNQIKNIQLSNERDKRPARVSDPPSLSEKLRYDGFIRYGKERDISPFKYGRFGSSDWITKHRKFARPLRYSYSEDKNPFLYAGAIPNFAFDLLGKFPKSQAGIANAAAEQIIGGGYMLNGFQVPTYYRGQTQNDVNGQFGIFDNKAYINAFSTAKEGTYRHEYGHLLDSLMGTVNGARWFSQMNAGKLGAHWGGPQERMADVFSALSGSGGGRIGRMPDYNFTEDSVREFLSKFNSGSLGTVQDILKYRKATGLIPNFNNALTQAISREVGAGIQASQVRIGSSPLLKSPLNTAGLGVYNTKDEPGGLAQGINRIAAMGLDPKRAGIPNFAQNVPAAYFNPQFFSDPRYNPTLQGQLPNNVQGPTLPQPFTSQEARAINNNIQIYWKKIQEGLSPASTYATQLSNSISRMAASAARAKGLTDRFVNIYTRELNTYTQRGARQAGNFFTTNRSSESAKSFREGGILSDIQRRRIVDEAQIRDIAEPNFVPTALNALNKRSRNLNIFGSDVLRIGADAPRLLYSNYELQNKTLAKQISPQIVNIINDEIQQISQAVATGVLSNRNAGRRGADLLRFANAQGIIGSDLNRLGVKLQGELGNAGIARGINRQVTANDTNIRRAIDTAINSDDRAGLLRLVSGNREYLSYARQQASARLMTQDRQSLESFGGLGAIFPLTQRSRAASNRLRQNNPELLNQLRTGAQTRLLLGSSLAPIVGNVVSEGILQATGGTTKESRGIAQSISSLANVASFAGAGAAFGGVGAGIGAGIGLLTELPKIFSSFTSILPDLQKELESLKDTTQSTTVSINGAVTASEKLADIFSGQITGVSNRDVASLQNVQSQNISRIPSLKARNEIQSLISSGNISEARRRGDVFTSISSQNESLKGLESEIQKLFETKKIRSSSDIASEINARLGANTIGGLSPVYVDRSKEIEAQVNKIQSSQENKDLFDKIYSNVQSSIFSNINEEGKSLFEVISNSQGNLSKVNTASSQGIEELNKAIAEIATKSKFDIKSIISIGNILDKFKGLDKGQLKPLLDLFSSNDILKQKQSFEEFTSSLTKQRREIELIARSIDNYSIKLSKISTQADLSAIERTGRIQRIGINNSANVSLRSGLSNIRFGGGPVLDVKNTFAESEQARINQLTSEQNANEEEVQSSLRKNLANFIQTSFEAFGKKTQEGILKETPQGAQRAEAFRKGLESDFPEVLNPNIKISPKDLQNRLEKLQIKAQKNLSPELTQERLTNLQDVNERLQNKKLTVQERQTLEERRDTLVYQLVDLRVITENISNIRKATEEAAGSYEKQAKKIEENDKSTEEEQRKRKDIALYLEKIKASERLRTIGISGRNERFNIGIEANNANTILGKNPLQINEILSRGQSETNFSNKISALSGEIGPVFGPQVEKANSINDLKSVQVLAYLTGQTDIYNKIDDIVKQLTEDELTRKENLKKTNEETIRQLKLIEGRSSAVRNKNQGNAIKGNFKQINDELGKTFLSELDFGREDFFNQLSEDVQNFGKEFKGTFKSGFADAITGVKTFGEAARGIGLDIAKSFLVKTSNLAVDSLFGMASQSLGGGQNSQFLTKLLGRSSGGLIPRYSKGGFVNMGSGVKDDVPAFLSGGEFVVRKSAVNKIGRRNLEKINNNSQLPKQTDSILIGDGSISALLANEYYGYGPRNRPTSGELNVSPLLSDFALNDENNPQNKLRLSREQYFIDLKNYQRNKRKSLQDFEAKKKTGLYTAIGTSLFNFGVSNYLNGAKPNIKPGSVDANSASALKYGYQPYTNPAPAGTRYDPIGNVSYNSYFRAQGGLIKAYASGGHVFGGDMYSDKIPAMLMGGEFVVKKSVVDKYGSNFFNNLNNSGARGYAYGGVVGNTYSPEKLLGTSQNNDISDYFSRLIDISREIRDSLVGARNNAQIPQNGSDIKNNFEISINISMADGKTNSESVQTNANTQQQPADGQQSSRGGIDKQTALQLSSLVKTQVMEVLGKESRPGGLLNQRYKTK